MSRVPGQARVRIRSLVVFALLGCAAALPLRAAGQQPRTVADGVYTVEQAARGKRGYAVFCESCHAADLAGTNSGDSGAPPLKREGFMAGSDAAGLFTKIQETMPLDAPGSLPPDDVIDILAFIFQENGFRAGGEPLRPEAAHLRNIRIVRAGQP